MDPIAGLLILIAALLGIIGTGLFVFLKDVKDGLRQLRLDLQENIAAILATQTTHGEDIAKLKERTARQPYDIDRSA